MKPLAIDLYCGLGGWTEGLLAEGYDVFGFDVERHEYWVPENPDSDGMKGTRPVAKRGITQGCAVSLGMEGATARPRTKLLRYPAQLVLQDVLTLHGSQFKDAALIVASPPCQAYSYRAMPWKRAKALPPPDNTLFEACFRIQREACHAAGRHIPLVVENVRGAQKWVGRARWNFGSFYLWGDVPALMPMTQSRAAMKQQPYQRRHGTGSWFAIDMASARAGITNPGHIAVAHNTTSGKGQNPDGRKHGGDCFNDPSWPGKQGGVKQPGISGARNNGKGDAWFQDGAARHGSKSNARKAASAMIAKIPLVLARHIARAWKPTTAAQAA